MTEVHSPPKLSFDVVASGDYQLHRRFDRRKQHYKKPLIARPVFSLSSSSLQRLKNEIAIGRGRAPLQLPHAINNRTNNAVAAPNPSKSKDSNTMPIALPQLPQHAGHVDYSPPATAASLPTSARQPVSPPKRIHSAPSIQWSVPTTPLTPHHPHSLHPRNGPTLPSIPSPNAANAQTAKQPPPTVHQPHKPPARVAVAPSQHLSPVALSPPTAAAVENKSALDRERRARLMKVRLERLSHERTTSLKATEGDSGPLIIRSSVLNPIHAVPATTQAKPPVLLPPLAMSTADTAPTVSGPPAARPSRPIIPRKVREERFPTFIPAGIEPQKPKDPPPKDALQSHAVRLQLHLRRLRLVSHPPAGPPARRPSLEPSSVGPSPRAAPTRRTNGQLPLSPAAALRLFSERLSAYERAEIQQYSEVWCVGSVEAGRIRVSMAGPGHFNEGFDDARGDYRVVVGDHIAYRYEVEAVLGRGAFGQVVRAFDHQRGETVALKMVRNRERFFRQGQVEVRILERLRNSDPDDRHHVVHMRDHFVFRQHLCITFELLSNNLYEFLQANAFRGCSLDLIRRFAIQLLRALRFMACHRVIHCDMKPENILLKQPGRSGIKVIDFGSSCFEDEQVYTYIQSRFYRAPEVILALGYDCRIDMWSLGCILSELYTGTPLFPGEDEHDQLDCIMEVLGAPPPQMVTTSSRRNEFFDANGNLLPRPSARLRRVPGSKTLERATECNDKLFVDFLTRCLRWQPEGRMTPVEALQHPWIIAAFDGLLKRKAEKLRHSEPM